MKPQSPIKTHVVHVANQWGRSFETAFIRVTTDRGAVLTIYKQPPSRLRRKWSEIEQAVIVVEKLRTKTRPDPSADNMPCITLTSEELDVVHGVSDQQDIPLETLGRKFFNRHVHFQKFNRL